MKGGFDWVPASLLRAACLVENGIKRVEEVLSARTESKIAKYCQNLSCSELFEQPSSMSTALRSGFTGDEEFVLKRSVKVERAVEIWNMISHVESTSDVNLVRVAIFLHAGEIAKAIGVGTTQQEVTAAFMKLAYRYVAFKHLAAFIKENVDELYQDVDINYTVRHIPKRGGGERVICIPDAPLKKKQKLLLRYLYLCRLPIPKSVAAFLPNRGISYALQKHKGNDRFLKVDFKDAFPSITEEMLANRLAEEHIPAYAVSQIVKYCLHPKFGLPQGAPTSGYLFNLVLFPFDAIVESVLKRFSATYTRYADDILVSWRASESRVSVSKLLRMIRRYLPPGLEINKRKIKVRRNHCHALGAVIHADGSITISRKRRRIMRARVHHGVPTTVKSGIKGWLKVVYEGDDLERQMKFVHLK